MIKKFKNFDPDEFLSSESQALREWNEENDTTWEKEDDDPRFSEDNVIIGTPVYKNPVLMKISNIVKKALNSAGIGEYCTGYNIIYLDGVPGIQLHRIDTEDMDIICCRDTNRKFISVFKNFKINSTNTAEFVYSSMKFGFKDMIRQLINDLKGESEVVSESVLNEAEARYGIGFTAKNVAIFDKLSWPDKNFVYEYVRKAPLDDAVGNFYDDVVGSNYNAVRILKAYVGGELKTGTDAQAKKLMDLAYTVVTVASGGKLTTKSLVKAVEDGVVTKLISEYSAKCGTSGSPAILTTAGTPVDVVDDEESRLADIETRRKEHQKEIEADIKNYEDTIEELKVVTRAMCHYVKNNGVLNTEEKSMMQYRAYLLTGKAGIGKSQTILDVLEDEQMEKGKDYVWVNLKRTTSDFLYTLMHDYNGKLLIFDDAPLLFDGEYRVSLWKNALQTNIKNSTISFPGSESGLKVYDVEKAKDRKKRYFMEIGHKSNEDRLDFYKKAMAEKGLRWTKDRHGVDVPYCAGMSTEEARKAMTKIDAAWADEEADIKPSMPNEITFTGLVIIITNDDRATFRAKVKEGGWAAITSRFENFHISPMAESIWGVIKKKIMAEYNDTSIPNDACMIPRDMTEEFVAEVDRLVSLEDDYGNPTMEYQDLSWRTIVPFHNTLAGSWGRAHWKTKLERAMKTNKEN